MAQINQKSILQKAKQYMQSDKMQKKIEQYVDAAVLGSSPGGASARNRHIKISGINMAAKKFIEVLQAEIQSHAFSAGKNAASGGLGSTAIDALIKLDHGMPVKIGRNKYQIGVWFSEDLRRDSLAPDEYQGIDNIAALLNNGYTAGKTVYGIWNGHWPWNIPSLTQRDGAHFIENAIRNYMTNYAQEYGVISIEIDDAYK